jgi:hypothetical protein
MSNPNAKKGVVMRRQIDKHFRDGVLLAIGFFVVAMIGISLAKGRMEQSPGCSQLARIVAGQEHSAPDSRRFFDVERQAYGICARDPAAFRKLLRTS